MSEQSNALVTHQSALTMVLRQFADKLSTLADEEVPEAYEMADAFARALEHAKVGLRDRALMYLNVHGKKVTDKGTVETAVGEYLVRAIPTRTGYDPKKVEGMLRRRGLDPVAGMDPTITYRVNGPKLEELRAGGHITDGDLQSCKYSEGFRVEVKRGEG